MRIPNLVFVLCALPSALLGVDNYVQGRYSVLWINAAGVLVPLAIGIYDEIEHRRSRSPDTGAWFLSPRRRRPRGEPDRP